jgi:REP element-mobilizing transposase RayT
MHLVLRSSLARGAWSFTQPNNEAMIYRVLTKHAKSTSTTILGIGNAGNHLHLRVQFSSRKKYLRFIRSVSGEIALHIKKIAQAIAPSRNRSPSFSSQTQQENTRTSSSTAASSTPTGTTRNFWDRRPFSTIVSTIKYVNRLTDYIHINSIEGQGYPRSHARLVVKSWRDGTSDFDG